MKLSVIIPCFNAADTIAKQLEALANQHWSEPWEIIVSDNGSTDKTLEIVDKYRERLSNLRIINAFDRQGAGHARNAGAIAAKGDNLAFCDADDEVGSGWVASIGNALFIYDFVASRFETRKLNSAQLFRKHSQENGLIKYTYPPFLPHSGGCGIGIKKAIHEKVGGFDESMLRLQDTDYCWRIQLKGVKLHFIPEAVVHIRFRSTLKDNFNQARSWGEYNVYIYKKYQLFGMPKLSWKSGTKSWLKLMKRIPQLYKKENRNKWLLRFGWLLGRLQGSIKYRVLAL